MLNNQKEYHFYAINKVRKLDLLVVYKAKKLRTFKNCLLHVSIENLGHKKVFCKWFNKKYVGKVFEKI